MALIAVPRTKRIAWLIAYAALSLILGVWGAYDYLVRIPDSEARYVVFAEQRETFDRLQKRAETATLTSAEVAEYDAAKAVIEGFKEGGAPEPVPVYDRPLQLWVYVVGCGVIGTPWCLWSLVLLRRQRLELDAEGTLISNTGRLPEAQVKSIDMNRWMSKSIAVVNGSSGEVIKIDDYMLEGAHLIVGRIANRLEPLVWNTDATRVKSPEENSEVDESSQQESA